jgi:hypothetical protein
MHVPGGIVDEVSAWMLTVPILPFGVLIEIGELHQSPRANQCVGSLGGALGKGNSPSMLLLMCAKPLADDACANHL